MDINQNQQTNTFVKGMDTDTSDMLLGSDKYRYAENVRVVTNTENNTGELHLVEGTVEREQLTNKQILATNYVRDIAIYIAKDKDSSSTTENEDPVYTPGSWYVYKKIGNNNSERVFGPCTEPIWNIENNSTESDINTIKKSITTVVRYEAPQNIKLYIADSTGKHSIMVLNIANQYEQDGQGYNKFDQVFAYQRTLLPPAEVEIGVGSGSIVSGKVQYVYRLYSKNGAATPLSILSKTLSLYKNEYSGYEAEKRSGRSVSISIDVQNRNNLDYIQIYRISYQLSGEMPKISLVKDEKITSSFTDTGTNVIEDIGVSELLAMFTPFVYPTQIESKGDYLFAANMKYSQDDVNAQFENFDTRSYCRGNYIVHNNETIKFIDQPLNFINFIDDNDIDQNDIHHKAFENGQDFTAYDYNANHWNSFQMGGNDNMITYNGYGKNICWRYTYQNLPELSAQNQTGISEKENNNCTFRCGEVYRFGVRLYNQYGQASSVKWIADIMIPDGANMYTDSGTVKFRNVGIEFFKRRGSDWTGISGWEIVRCERTLNDRKSITQGIIGFPFHEYHVEDGTWIDTSLICNPGVLSTELMYSHQLTDGITSSYNNFAISDNNVIIVGSPEYCYQQDDIKDILTSYKNQLYCTKIYECIPNYERIGDTGYFRSVQNTNSSMAFAFKINQQQYLIGQENSKYYYSFNNLYAENTGYLQDFNDSANTSTLWFINYFTPNYTNFIIDTQKIKYNLKEQSFIDSPKSSDFAKDEQLIFKNNVTTIKNLQFINWTAPLLLNASGAVETDIKNYMDNIHDEVGAMRIVTAFPIGSGGKAILFESDSDNKISIDSADYFNNNYFGNHIPKITTVNINKYSIPYGGYNKTAIDNSTYISFGDYSSQDNIYVYSGDTYNRIFTYNSAHNWYDSTYKHGIKMASIYAIPVETDIDIQAQYGLLYNVEGFADYRIQDTADAFDTYTQNKDSYLYNPAYNATPDIISWTTPEALENKIDYFDTRVHYSNVKINNEDVDNWIQFQASNYIDVDSRYGEITDLKLFKDKLIFWQENATGLLAVNERVVLNDQNDTQVVLGTGGVLERYDYFTTVYGQKKNQHVRAQSNDSLYWWDENNKEILLYQNKYEVIPLSTVKGITNYINNNNASTIPFATYDNKYKEVLLNVVNNEAVVYNENIQAFTSVYKFNPLFDFIVSGKILLTSDNTIYEYNCQNVDDNEVNKSVLFSTQAHPLIQYVINTQPMYNKVFDIQTIGGRFYGGGYDDDLHERNNQDLQSINLIYKTPLKQEARSIGTDMTNVEYDYRITVPRAGYEVTENEQTVWKVNNYGDRLRGKTMRCEINSSSNNPDFSLQYITTKFRMSWS